MIRLEKTAVYFERIDDEIVMRFSNGFNVSMTPDEARWAASWLLRFANDIDPDYVASMCMIEGMSSAGRRL